MKIMIAVDESLYAKKMLNELLKRKWPDGAHFKLLTVLEPMAADSHEKLLFEINEHRREAATQYMSEMREKLEKTTGGDVHFEIREGHPPEEIIDAAIEYCPQQLFLGAYGLGSDKNGGGNGKGLGSVSHAVASKSPVSVSIVRA